MEEREMKKLLIGLILGIFPTMSVAQSDNVASLSAEARSPQAFRAYLYNKAYEVYLKINFYDQNVIVPGQELYGEVPGYLGKKNNSFCWIVTSAKLRNERTADLSLINDYGSEDLTASLTQQDDSTYVLKQLTGSTLKVPKNGKWQKLPKTLELKRQK